MATVQIIAILVACGNTYGTEERGNPVLTGLAFFPESVLLLLKAGLLTPSCETPSRNVAVALEVPHLIGNNANLKVTAAGTVSDFHRIPFSSNFVMQNEIRTIQQEQS